MKITHHLLNALTGWAAGLLATFLFSMLWQQVLPVVERTGQGAVKMPLLIIILAIVSPLMFAGGVIGGRLPREGGRVQMLVYAALFGVLFAIPVSCFLFWYSGW
jgi:hypothetical protein